MTIPPLYPFFQSPLLKTFLKEYRPNEIQDKHKNKSMRESCFFMFRRLQINFTRFFWKQLFYIHQEAKIWFETSKKKHHWIPIKYLNVFHHNRTQNQVKSNIKLFYYICKILFVNLVFICKSCLVKFIKNYNAKL